MSDQPGEQPTHWLTQTRAYDGGYTTRNVWPSHHLTAAEAQKSRTSRLKDAGTPHSSGPGWVTYREDWHPADLICDVRLEWTNSNPED